MKLPITLLVPGFVFLVTMGCRKTEVLTPQTTQTGMTQIDTTIHAYAGNDVILILPQNETYLNGSYSHSNIEYSFKTIWTKVSGPASFAIENKNALRTKVSNLEEGVYQFELTITDAIGRYDKDTVVITIRRTAPVYTNEIIYENLEWIFPWYAAIEIKNFNSLLPPGSLFGSLFEIFIQRDNDPRWTKVTPTPNDYDLGIKYEYFIETRPYGAGMYNFGSLYIFYYGTDVSDTPNVKIVF